MTEREPSSLEGVHEDEITKICAYCKGLIQKALKPEKAISHGACQECFDREISEIRARKALKQILVLIGSICSTQV